VEKLGGYIVAEAASRDGDSSGGSSGVRSAAQGQMQIYYKIHSQKQPICSCCGSEWIPIFKFLMALLVNRSGSARLELCSFYTLKQLM